MKRRETLEEARKRVLLENPLCCVCGGKGLFATVHPEEVTHCSAKCARADLDRIRAEMKPVIAAMLGK